MALQLGALYDALRAERPTEAQARAAAEEVASYESRMQAVERDLAVLKYTTGTIVALLLLVIGLGWATRNDVNALAATVAGIQADVRYLHTDLRDVKIDTAAILARLPAKP